MAQNEGAEGANGEGADYLQRAHGHLREKNLFHGPDPTRPEVAEEFRRKSHSKLYDPCADASKASLRCLERHNYEKEPCYYYFQVGRPSSRLD